MGEQIVITFPDICNFKAGDRIEIFNGSNETVIVQAPQILILEGEE